MVANQGGRLRPGLMLLQYRKIICSSANLARFVCPTFFRSDPNSFGVIKREPRRRSAIEPIIGHLKTEGHLGHYYLKGRAGDAANVTLSAIGCNCHIANPAS